jgi:hypothetical protein
MIIIIAKGIRRKRTRRLVCNNINPESFVDLLTRIRHIGTFPAFISNDLITLPDEKYS